MNRSFLSLPLRRTLAALCTVAAAGLLTTPASGQGTTPSGSGSRRNPRAASSAASPKAAAPTPAPTPAATPGPLLSGQEAAVAKEPGTAGDAPASAATATPAPETTQTQIDASSGASFASKERIAVFNGDVRVRDPKFQLACDKLTVFLNKSADKNAPSTTATPPPLTPGASPAPADKSAAGGGIDHANAEGHVIIIQERPPTGAGGEAKRSVGRADWASFDNKTGDMTLKGTPSVEQNGNTHVATSPNTVMVLRRDNSLQTTGPSRTLITQRHGTDLPGATGTGGGQTASPAPANGRGTH